MEHLNEKQVKWKDVAEKFNDVVVNKMDRPERVASLLRERWARVIKTKLLEKEQDPEAVKRYRLDLLEHVIGLGVSDPREIKWKEVAKHFHPRTSSSLTQDFWVLTKFYQQTKPSFKAALEAAHSNLVRKMEKNPTKLMTQSEDAKGRLLDFYRSLF